MSEKIAKRIRKEVREMKYSLASELKTAILEMSFKNRVLLALKIVFRKRKW